MQSDHCTPNARARRNLEALLRVTCICPLTCAFFSGRVFMQFRASWRSLQSPYADFNHTFQPNQNQEEVARKISPTFITLFTLLQTLSMLGNISKYSMQLFQTLPTNNEINISKASKTRLSWLSLPKNLTLIL